MTGISGQCKLGVYPSFFSFRENRPMPGVDIELKDRVEEEDTHIKSWAFVLTSKHGIKKHQLRKLMWGFCAKGELFISSSNYAQNRRSGTTPIFSKVLHWGRYSYFYGTVTLSEKSAFVLGGLGGLAAVSEYYLIDMLKGEIKVASLENVREIISRDTVLIKEFNKDKSLKQKLLTYIEKYNERNPY